jgi:hypothetical protein
VDAAQVADDPQKQTTFLDNESKSVSVTGATTDCRLGQVRIR